MKLSDNSGNNILFFQYQNRILDLQDLVESLQVQNVTLIRTYEATKYRRDALKVSKKLMVNMMKLEQIDEDLDDLETEVIESRPYLNSKKHHCSNLYQMIIEIRDLIEEVSERFDARVRRIHRDIWFRVTCLKSG